MQTGEFLKKVSVQLTRLTAGHRSYTGEQGYSAISAADGSFRFEAVEPGEYRLSGERPGFLYTEYGAQAANDFGTILTLRPAQQLTDLNLKLFPQGVISGKVVDQDGDPVGNARLKVVRRKWISGKLRYGFAGSTSANELGEFRFRNLEPGKYYVDAQAYRFDMRAAESSAAPGKPDIRPIRTFYPEATALEAAAPVEVSSGSGGFRDQHPPPNRACPSRAGKNRRRPPGRRWRRTIDSQA